MPSPRHDPDRTILVRTFGVTFRRNDLHRIIPPNARNWDQLIYATSGMMTVHAENCCWAVPPHRAIRVPAALPCRIEMHGEVALRMLYLRTRSSRTRTCSVVNVTPLLRELIVRTIGIGALDSTVPSHRHIHAILRDELKTLHTIPLQLPAPKDRRAIDFAKLADAAGAAVGIPHLLRCCGASRRTMERLFHEETNMRLGQWLRRQKLLRALRLLAAGHSVKQSALELGYANASAFIAMFRRELGETPARYFES